MRKSIVVILGIALAGATAPPAAADQSHCSARVENSYSAHYYAVAEKFGTRQPGRNIRRYGLADRPARCSDLRRSLRTFNRWLAPPLVAAAVSDLTPATARIASTPYRAGGRYAIPTYIVMCESHGNYNAVNPSTGAYGAYQIMPFHWSSGVCRGLGRNPAGQDQCAARIWSSSGASAWSCA